MARDDRLPSAEEILAIHEEIAEQSDMKFRGVRVGAPRLRIREIVDGADAHDEVHGRAAFLLRNLITAHVFEDGNKRTPGRPPGSTSNATVPGQPNRASKWRGSSAGSAATTSTRSPSGSNRGHSTATDWTRDQLPKIEYDSLPTSPMSKHTSEPSEEEDVRARVRELVDQQRELFEALA